MKGSKTNIQHNRVDSNKTKLCMKKEKLMKVLLCNIPRELKKKSIYLGKAAKQLPVNHLALYMKTCEAGRKCFKNNCKILAI